MPSELEIWPGEPGLPDAPQPPPKAPPSKPPRAPATPPAAPPAQPLQLPIDPVNPPQGKQGGLPDDGLPGGGPGGVVGPRPPKPIPPKKRNKHHNGDKTETSSNESSYDGYYEDSGSLPEGLVNSGDGGTRDGPGGRRALTRAQSGKGDMWSRLGASWGLRRPTLQAGNSRRRLASDEGQRQQEQQQASLVGSALGQRSSGRQLHQAVVTSSTGSGQGQSGKPTKAWGWHRYSFDLVLVACTVLPARFLAHTRLHIHTALLFHRRCYCAARWGAVPALPHPAQRGSPRGRPTAALLPTGRPRPWGLKRRRWRCGGRDPHWGPERLKAGGSVQHDLGALGVQHRQVGRQMRF